MPPRLPRLGDSGFVSDMGLTRSFCADEKGPSNSMREPGDKDDYDYVRVSKETVFEKGAPGSGNYAKSVHFGNRVESIYHGFMHWVWLSRSYIRRSKDQDD